MSCKSIFRFTNWFVTTIETDYSWYQQFFCLHVHNCTKVFNLLTKSTRECTSFYQFTDAFNYKDWIWSKTSQYVHQWWNCCLYIKWDWYVLFSWYYSYKTSHERNNFVLYLYWAFQFCIFFVALCFFLFLRTIKLTLKFASIKRRKQSWKDSS